MIQNILETPPASRPWQRKVTLRLLVTVFPGTVITEKFSRSASNEPGKHSKEETRSKRNMQLLFGVILGCSWNSGRDKSCFHMATTSALRCGRWQICKMRPLYP